MKKKADWFLITEQIPAKAQKRVTLHGMTRQNNASLNETKELQQKTSIV